MSFPKTRAQSSSSSIPPDYITGSGIDAHAMEVRSKTHPFLGKKLDENVLHLFGDTLILGPRWYGTIPPEVAELLEKDAVAPLCFESSSALSSHSWASKHLSRSFPSSEVRNSSAKWADWVDKLLPRHEAYWKRAGLYDAILLSKQSITRDENLLAAALCFWNSASNTFDFRVGPMTPTLLDMAQIFGFRPHGRPVDAVGDYHRRKNQEKLSKPFTISPAVINQNCSFSNFLRKFSTEKDEDQEHMLFLLYWLNRFVFPNRSSAVLLEYRHLAEALHNHTDVGLGPSVLAHLFKNLHTATMENPLNLTAPGSFWMIQIWLQVYFPELRLSDVVLPEDQVLALPLIKAEVPKRSIEEYLMWFRHCTKRSDAQWQLVIKRTYPWFQPGHRLFEKEPEEEADRTDFRKKFLSVALVRDLPHGGGKPPNYHLGAEAYHPNFCARQLGCPQVIPFKFYRSCNRASSWRDSDDLEVHKAARCAVNKINNTSDALFPSWKPNTCTSPDFDAWWKARCHGLPNSVDAFKILFEGWTSGNVYAEAESKKFVVRTIKEVNAQFIEGPFLKEVGGGARQAGGISVSSVIAAGDLEPPSEEDVDETLSEQPAVATPSAGRKRKESVPAQGRTAPPADSPSPPPLTRSKRLRKRNETESDEAKRIAANPTETSDDELLEAFEAIEQEKQQGVATENPSEKKGKDFEEEEEIPPEVIAESIALAQQQRAMPGTELTASELALFEDAEAEHSTAAPASEEQPERSVSEPVEQAEAPVAVPANLPVSESVEQAELPIADQTEQAMLGSKEQIETSSVLEPVEQVTSPAANLAEPSAPRPVEQVELPVATLEPEIVIPATVSEAIVSSCYLFICCAQCAKPTSLHHLLELLVVDPSISIHIHLHDHPLAVLYSPPLLKPERGQNRPQLINGDEPISVLIKHIKRLLHVFVLITLVHDRLVQLSKLINVDAPVPVYIDLLDHVEELLIRDKDAQVLQRVIQLLLGDPAVPIAIKHLKHTF